MYGKSGFYRAMDLKFFKIMVSYIYRITVNIAIERQSLVYLAGGNSGKTGISILQAFLHILCIL
jgi:hypothetical protein